MRKGSSLFRAAVAAALMLSAGGIATLSAAPAVGAAGAPTSGTPVCDQSILNSPWNYTGAAGSYTSGTAELPTYGAAGTNFPNATAGEVIAPGWGGAQGWQLSRDTVYYLEPGTDGGEVQTLPGDVFVGGYANGRGTVMDGGGSTPWAFDDSGSNSSGVTIEYLSIQNYEPPVNAGAVNPDANTGWTMDYDTFTRNVPGGGVFAGSGGTLEDDCMTQNGQYGFQTGGPGPRDAGSDALTGSAFGVTVKNNEISYNDICDLEGPTAAGADPVPASMRDSNCNTGPVSGAYGGFKAWGSDGVLIEDNYIHNNFGQGAWFDTDNANTTITGNYISSNDREAVMEEISYNFSITDNTMVDNNWFGGLNNPRFPTPAVYISESGSDTTFGGVPACSETACRRFPSYPKQSVVSGNVLTDNGGGIFLYQNPTRYCGDSSDNVCTLVDSKASGGSPFTQSACRSNWLTASPGEMTGSPAEDWYDGCLWKTESVSVNHNIINFTPSNVSSGCQTSSWPDCGANGIFSPYGSPPNNQGGAVIPTELTFQQNNVFADNTYTGSSSTFYAWNQGNNDDPVSWADWTAPTSDGNHCQSPGELQSGTCTGPFGQDAGSSYHRSGDSRQAPSVATNAATGVKSSLGSQYFVALGLLAAVGLLLVLWLLQRRADKDGRAR